VIRALAVFVCIVAGVLAFAGSAAQAAARSQSLGITLHRTAAATERLEYYHAATPISVHVGGRYARRLSQVTAIAHGPNGVAVTTPLTRDGLTFSGNLRLATPGSWNVAFSTQSGSVNNAALATVPLDVVSVGSADLAGGIAFAIGALALIAGLALVVRVDGRPLAFRLRYAR